MKKSVAIGVCIALLSARLSRGDDHPIRPANVLVGAAITVILIHAGLGAMAMYKSYCNRKTKAQQPPPPPTNNVPTNNIPFITQYEDPYEDCVQAAGGIITTPVDYGVVVVSGKGEFGGKLAINWTSGEALDYTSNITATVLSEGEAAPVIYNYGNIPTVSVTNATLVVAIRRNGQVIARMGVTEGMEWSYSEPCTGEVGIYDCVVSRK